MCSSSCFKDLLNLFFLQKRGRANLKRKRGATSETEDDDCDEEEIAKRKQNKSKKVCGRVQVENTC